jgi:phosphoenolpyruvate synthase/pyruvate phosphate dikinase
MDWIYLFGGGEAEGGRADKDLLGGKGANLAEMTRLGLPVPPGFTITTRACLQYLETGDVPAGLREEVDEALARQRRYDPDLWIVEIEDPRGRLFLMIAIVLQIMGFFAIRRIVDIKF